LVLFFWLKNPTLAFTTVAAREANQTIAPRVRNSCIEWVGRSEGEEEKKLSGASSLSQVVIFIFYFSVSEINCNAQLKLGLAWHP
jgi:hypothetical protein